MTASREYKGWYARVEGPDGAGKSTLLSMAKEYAAANNIPTLFIREPGTGEFGEEIRNYLLHKNEYSFSPQTEYALFTANRTHVVSDVIYPALLDGFIVLGDRGVESSGAMQGGRAGEITAQTKGWESSLSTQEIFEIAQMLLPDFYNRPDGFVLLSLSKEVRRARMRAKSASIGTDKIESRVMEFSDAVHDTYINYETTLPYATVINAELPMEEVFEKAKPILFGPDHA